MLSTTLDYYIFLIAVFLLHLFIPNKWRNSLLLGASYYFYSLWDIRFLFILVASTAVHYFCARSISRTPVALIKKRLLFIAIGFSLLTLGLFKYFNFFSLSFSSLLKSMGFASSPLIINIIQPVGVSFYSFVMIAYTVNVYRGTSKFEGNPISFALFCSFFPAVLSGPIERASNLLTQINTRRDIRFENVKNGLLLIMVGLFKKIVIADFVALKAAEVFASPEYQLAGKLLEGMYFYTLQIYCDFSGYTDIARGSGKLLGFNILMNFKQPYLSASISEFWRRWHISLSNFIKDYIYIPLGGNRQGWIRTYANLMITMLLCGLWHGANWTFVVWGGLHGILLCGHRLIFREMGVGNSIKTKSAQKMWDIAGIFLTFNLVSFAWIFFNSSDIGSASTYISSMLSPQLFSTFPYRVLFIFLCIAMLDIPFLKEESDYLAIRRWPVFVRGTVYAALFALIVNFSGGSEVPFVYFNF